MALMAGRVSFAQSVAEQSATLTLPDAPSYSSSEQQGAGRGADAAQSGPVANETAAERRARERAEAEREVKEEEKQRIGGVVPNFNVVMGGTAVPLTAKEKFDLSFHTIIDPYTVAIAAVFGGGYGELADDHTGYGHGPAGYFERTGASYADNIIGNFVGNAMLPIVLKQDPRYFRKGTGSIKSRIVYSALTTFICRGDNGHKQANVSNVLGNFVAGAISNAYYPEDERGVGLTISNATVVTLEGMVGAQLLEFSPDVIGHFQRRRQAKREARDAAAAAVQTATPTPVTP